MALQTSGQISINDLRNEFGDTPGSDSLSEYYRGGAYVPNTSQNSSIPTGGQISLSNFYGTAAALPIPYTNYMRSSSTADAVYGTYSRTGGIVAAVATLDVRLRRADPYVYLEVKEGSSPPSTTWYNTSGTGSTLSTSYRTMLRFNLTGITQIRLEWSISTSGSGSTNVGANSGVGATYGAVNNTWRSVSNGQSIGFRMTSNTFLAECYASLNSTHQVLLYAHARKSGYLDTRLGAYRLRHRLFATSNNCF